MSDDRVQHLLAKQAELDQLQAQVKAELSSLRSIPLSTSPSSSSQLGRVHKHQQHRRGNMSRSSSTNGPIPMGRHISSDRMDIPQQRPRTFSQRSAPSMARTNSKGSSSQRSGNLPFIQNGAMPPPLHLESRRETPVIMAWTQQDQPLSSYNLSHQPLQLQRSISQRGPELEHVPEILEDLTDPDDYLRGIRSSFDLSPSISIPSPSTANTHRHSGSFSISTPLTPSSDMLTSATTFTDTMSRQDSLCNEPLLEGMQKMKFNSSFSHDVNHEISMHDQVNQFSSLHTPCPSSSEEQSKLLVGAGGASHESQISHSYSFTSPTVLGERMQKSQSNESTSSSFSSSSSSSSRNVKRLYDQIRLARPLIPKGGSVNNAMSRENSSQSMACIESQDGSQDSKIPISKPAYQRPKHERMFCDECDNHQEGFRGQHELSRHKDREHKSTVKKWQCIEPENGLQNVKPVVPLARCKACTQHKKRYGAYYNAAAHLRRTHFNPKAKGRGKSNKIDEAEKRGGKGGGDWPSMSELKYWMKEVEEQVTDYNEDTLSMGADEEETNNNSVDDLACAPQAFEPSEASSFESSFFTTTPMLHAFPVNTRSDIYGVQNMPLDLSSSSQESQCGLDQTMFDDSCVQNDFSCFSSDAYQQQQQPQQLQPQVLYDTSFLASLHVENQLLAGPDIMNHYY